MTPALVNTSRASVKTLHDRAQMLAKARAFFSKREVCEVDCPILSQSASVDAYIDLIPASPTIGSGKRRAFLHSSPEYGMKRLLAEGMGDIYQLSHVFRDGEAGKKHNPEFTMVEWYRIGFPYSQMIDETVDFVRLFIGDIPYKMLTYREAFERYAGFDYTKVNHADLLAYVEEHQIEAYPNIDEEELLNLILAVKVEPNLGQDHLLVLTEYPASQAALAKVIMRDGIEVAERFEVYFQGMELANGYHELTDVNEQRERFHEENACRLSLGKEELPIDENFLAALEKGIPDCCGVAVGFDRLMMLRHNQTDIASVIPFSWEDA